MGWTTSFIRDDRVVLASLGIGVVSLVYFMQTILEHYRDKAEIKPVQPKTQYITQETEDSIQLSTLETLLGHYNYGIREVAAKIICERAAHDDSVIETLLWGITRPDYDERMKNLRALAMIMDNYTISKLDTRKGYSALVRSLELSLDPEEETLDDEDWDEEPLRDWTEKTCLVFIKTLIDRRGNGNPIGLEKLVKAGFVQKWVAKQNWGSSVEQRQQNFAKYMHNRHNRIKEILVRVRATLPGHLELEKAGLVRETFEEDHDNDVSLSSDFIGQMLSGIHYLGGDDIGARLEARTSTMEQSLEELRLRQRHREAMVLNDGNHPLNSGDIIQRDYGGPPPADLVGPEAQGE
ncbi:hypothetical protein QBC46DRAFT_382484 [Diplogelasinospora grovesii]|uniref:Cytoskeleton-associated protein n=1 Tax=Diplogelasinospora grovesii TaxID=303347 RepID=A0AAN6S685_9PEZI|nr:hypothetical protein QBC46DRAFT_382484 [Diplogelasinospora grovesii]